MRQSMQTIVALASLLTSIVMSPAPAHAAAGIFASGGGSVTAGEKFTVTVKASGTTFDSLQGTISVSGPVEIVSFSAGSATWLPGKTPGNGQQFVGIATATSDLVVARITLKGTKEGSGSVSVSGAKLASKGAVVATDAGGTNFTIKRAPSLPGTISVSSATHPDQGVAYEARTVELSWNKPSGVSEFAYTFDKTANTTPSGQTSTATSAKYENQEIGTYYFHIRGKNGDGWGPVTHYKVTIKEPDPKVVEGTVKPVIAKVVKAKTFITDLEAGTLSGITLSGTGQPDYTLNLSFSPSPGDLPAGSLSTKIDATGVWQLTLDTPLKAGVYKVTAQAQLDKALTPASEPVTLELSIAKGGNVQFITAKDAVPSPVPTPTPSPTAVQGWRSGNMMLIWAALFAVVATGLVAFTLRLKGRRK